MVLKVHGTKGSTCTQRVLTALHEKGVPYELIIIDFKVAEHKSEKYMKLQPFGKIPVLDDDGFILFESRAIARYIAKKYAGQGTPLLPAEDDLKAYGLFEQACSLEQFYFDPAASQIAFEKVFKGLKGLGGPDEAQLAKLAAALDTTLAVYEGLLQKHKYLVGDELTLADLFHIPYGKMARDVGYLELFEKYPHVAKWFDGLLARESWKKTTS
ncbi:putative glutathione S-transferase [Hyaloscypha variabilis F]|uniref:glutathione transferase n=1 Tax=Hyaloscypha variabilis (strain UAMH 11265 / GT02V1 / F) TaxID=1149755 RepID=A0A2J6RS47_HYAVF|nr:putative glutathione S-transferase [Hyaloscypha variabilis F]